jgi:hypothetical protein
MDYVRRKTAKPGWHDSDVAVVLCLIGSMVRVAIQARKDTETASEVVVSGILGHDAAPRGVENTLYCLNTSP